MSRTLVKIYLTTDIIDAIDEQKAQISPNWSREDYVEHLVAVHKSVLDKLKEDKDND